MAERKNAEFEQQRIMAAKETASWLLGITETRTAAQIHEDEWNAVKDQVDSDLLEFYAQEGIDPSLSPSAIMQNTLGIDAGNPVIRMMLGVSKISDIPLNQCAQAVYTGLTSKRIFFGIQTKNLRDKVVVPDGGIFNVKKGMGAYLAVPLNFKRELLLNDPLQIPLANHALFSTHEVENFLVNLFGNDNPFVIYPDQAKSIRYRKYHLAEFPDITL